VGRSAAEEVGLRIEATSRTLSGCRGLLLSDIPDSPFCKCLASRAGCEEFSRPGGYTSGVRELLWVDAADNAMIEKTAAALCHACRAVEHPVFTTDRDFSERTLRPRVVEKTGQHVNQHPIGLAGGSASARTRARSFAQMEVFGLFGDCDASATTPYLH
jgi:hypothetical protein